jgi:hypothetical protein
LKPLSLQAFFRGRIIRWKSTCQSTSPSATIVFHQPVSWIPVDCLIVPHMLTARVSGRLP